MKLKSFKTLNVFSDGSIYFCSSSFFKNLKKSNLLEKDFKTVWPKKKDTLRLKESKSFDLKYRSQFFKIII